MPCVIKNFVVLLRHFVNKPVEQNNLIAFTLTCGCLH